jgi:vitamin B12 transporter
MRKILIVIGTLVAVATHGQDSAQTTLLREIVFSAGRIDEVLLDVPRSASIIPRAVIEKSNFNSVGELLSSQEGIYVVGVNQNPGTNQNIFLRGANSNQVVVMIDGKRINDPSAPNAAVDLSELSLTDVERIEIIRGSHTTAYGGAAVGGVINIITRRNVKEGLRTNISLQAGSFGNSSSTFTEQLDLGYGLSNGLYFNGALWQQDVNGLDATVKNAGPAFTTRDKDDFHKTDVAMKAGYRKGAWDMYAGYKKSDQRAEIDNGAFADDDNNYVAFKRNLGDYLIKYAIDDHWSVSGAGAYTRSERINENDSSVIDETGTTDKSFFRGAYHGALVTSELQFDYRKDRLSAVFGAGSYYENMFFDTYFYSNAFGFPYESATDYDSIDSSTVTQYLFGKLAYNMKDLNLAFGTRVSHHSLFGNYLTYELNPSYKFRNGLVYASLTTGYNAPSLYQLYDPTKGFNAFSSRGNRKLQPEESVSLEVGAKHDFTTGSYLTVAVFRTVVKNSIDYIYLWDGDTPLEDLDYSHYRGDTYINSATQSVNGVEVSGKVHFSSILSLNANLSILDARVEISAADIDRLQTGNNHIQLYNYGVFLQGKVEQRDLVRRPGLLANAQLIYTPVDEFSLTLGYRLAGSRFDSGYDAFSGPFGALKRNEVDAYHLVDLSSSYRINNHFSLALKLENILDEKYSEIAGYRTRGRSIYVKVLYKL